MTMIDQLIIGEKASFDDFDASVKERSISAPKKKTIKETVPFSNETYDFSNINGEIYWEERELKYVFEITAETPSELEVKKTAFSGWVMNVMKENIYDPHEPDFHYVGTFDDIDYSDEEGLEKTTITVTFSAYPYKISNKAKSFKYTLLSTQKTSVTIENDSAHRIVPTITVDFPVVIGLNGSIYAVSAGTTTDSKLMFSSGKNDFTLQNTNNSENVVQISFFEEVF